MTLNSIVANFQTFKLVDLLDILIIAFLIYQLLGFVNRTRAGQLAKGALDDIGLVDDDDIEYRYEVYPYINAKNVIENK